MKRLFSLVLLSSLLVACGEESGNDLLDGAVPDVAPLPDRGPVVGTLGGKCYPNNTCNAGLVCKAGRCRRQPDAGVPDLPPPPDMARPDRPLPTPDLRPPDQTLAPDLVPSGCTPPGYKPLRRYTSSAGDWALALDLGQSYTTLTLASVQPKEAAAVFDFDQNWQQVAGFVVSRPSTNVPETAESQAAISALASTVGGAISTVSAGISRQTHDGYRAVLLSEVRITTKSSSDVATVRRAVVEALTKRTVAQITGWPKPFGAGNTTFVLRFATVLRSDSRVIFVGAVTDEPSDQDFKKLSQALTLDAASATGLARASRLTDFHCDSQTITQPTTPVDIIWVIDESGSMASKRSNIAQNAQTFFSLAQAAGLDFRMGVTSVCSPTGSCRSLTGKFCSRASSSTNDDGGTDRFLLPSEASTFSACIQNPPGYEGGQEWGLYNARRAIERHLPRASNSASRIRSGAQLVVIVATDEVPFSLYSILKSSVTSCTLNPLVQSQVDTALTSYLAYFLGLNNSQTKVDYFQVIGGVCNNICGAQVAHGYSDIAGQFNGAVYDVCQANLSYSIQKIITDIVTTTAPVKLARVPVASSVKVALDGTALSRSRSKGFSYLHGSNGLAFHGITMPKKGSKLVASYSIWK